MPVRVAPHAGTRDEPRLLGRKGPVADDADEAEGQREDRRERGVADLARAPDVAHVAGRGAHAGVVRVAPSPRRVSVAQKPVTRGGDAVEGEPRLSLSRTARSLVGVVDVRQPAEGGLDLLVARAGFELERGVRVCIWSRRPHPSRSPPLFSGAHATETKTDDASSEKGHDDGARESCSRE